MTILFGVFWPIENAVAGVYSAAIFTMALQHKIHRSGKPVWPFDKLRASG
jgi:hypothetical protein